MENAIGLFSRLGCRLRGFGDDARTREVIGRACRENGWFTPADICRAVAAVADGCSGAMRWRSGWRPTPFLSPNPGACWSSWPGISRWSDFFDMLCVLAAGHRCLVKPSAKDTVLMEYVIGLLRGIDPQVPVEFYDGSTSPDAVIATGSDNANRYFRAQYAGIPALLRGNRQSVAVLGGRETPAQLTALADDIWAYSGLGCRSVSLLFLPEGYDLQLRMPEVNVKYRNSYRQQKALLTMGGQPFRDLGAAVAVEERAFPAALSRINYSFYKSPAEVGAWLAAHDAGLQCVVSECIACRRRVDFGHAQSPGLTDYPDDRDVIEFLTTSCL